MNINFVVHSFDKSRLGGVLKVLSNLLNSFDLDKYHINVISLGKVDELAFPLDEKINLISLDVEKFDTTFYKGIKKLKWFWNCYKILKKMVGDTDDSIWISSSQPLSILFGLIKRNSNIMLGCEHASTSLQKDKFYYHLMLKIYSRLDMMISLTKEDEEFYLSNNIRCILIPNAFNINIQIKEKNNRSRIVFIGRFTDVKAPLDVIEIYNLSKLYHSGVTLSFYGYGELRDALIKKSKDLSLSTIEFISNESNLERMLKDAACLVMTSKSECLPSVLIEALSYNVPCISYDCEYGPRNIIKHGKNGYLVPVNDIDTFAYYLSEEKLSKFWDIDLRLSVQRYSIDKVIPMWESLFGSLLRDRKNEGI